MNVLAAVPAVQVALPTHAPPDCVVIVTHAPVPVSVAAVPAPSSSENLPVLGVVDPIGPGAANVVPVHASTPPLIPSNPVPIARREGVHGVAVAAQYIVSPAVVIGLTPRNAVEELNCNTPVVAAHTLMPLLG